MYTEDEVRLLLERTSDEEILAGNTRSSLSEMYSSVYGYNIIPSSWRKQDILNSLREFFSNLKRTEDLVSRYGL